MKRIFWGTRGRLALIHGALLTVAILVVDVAIYVTLVTVEVSASDSVLRSHANTIEAGIEETNGHVQFGGDLPAESQEGVAVDAVIVMADGSVIHTPAQPFPASMMIQVAKQTIRQGGSMMLDVTDSRGVPRRLFAEEFSVSQGVMPVLVVSRSVAELHATQTNIALFLAALSVLVVLTGTLLAYRLAGRVLHPVRRIATMARSLSQHDLHRRVDVNVPPDELGELVDTFNGMLARLEGSFDSLRRFTADASHELRTPLALMRTELEGTLTRPRTGEEYRRVLEEMELEVERMARTADQLLMLARADAGALVPAIEDLDVADVLHDTASRWHSVARTKDVSIEIEAPDSGVVAADGDLVRRVIDNLVDNAIRHSPKRGSVHLSGAQTDGVWRIEVSDEGSGVRLEDRPAIFARFARADHARVRDAGGAGLGLALSRAIAEAHGGTLDLVHGEGPGAVFQLLLPVTETSRHSRDLKP